MTSSSKKYRESLSMSPVGMHRSTRSLREHRYKGVIADEYRLVKLAYPNVEEFQGKVGQYVQMFAGEPTGQCLEVIEIGCGDGFTTNILLGSRTDMNLVALDLEVQMVESARQNLQAWQKTCSFSLVEADAVTYLEKLPESSIDIVASAWTLHNFLVPYRLQFLKSTYRVLKPGGLFVNGDKYAQDSELHHECLVIQMKRFLDAYLPIGEYEFLRDFILHNLDDEAPSRIMRDKDFIRDMNAIGFTETACVYRELMEAVYVSYKPRTAGTLPPQNDCDL